MVLSRLQCTLLDGLKSPAMRNSRRNVGLRAQAEDWVTRFLLSGNRSERMNWFSVSSPSSVRQMEGWEESRVVGCLGDEMELGEVEPFSAGSAQSGSNGRQGVKCRASIASHTAYV